MSTRSSMVTSFPKTQQNLNANLLEYKEGVVAMTDGKVCKIKILVPKNKRHEPLKARQVEWIDAHPQEVQSVLSTLIDKLVYVSQAEFEAKLISATTTFLEGQKGEFMILSSDNKSNAWTPTLAALLVQGKMVGVKPSKLGIKSAAEFSKRVDRKLAKIEQLKTRLAQLQSEEQLEDEKEQITQSISEMVASFSRTLVLFDDASYSGTQIYEHVEGVVEALLRVQKTLGDFELPDIKIVCPYVSTTAHERISTLVSKEKRFNISLIFEVKTPVVREVLPQESVEVLKNLWGERVDTLSLMFFDHKLPNGVSFPNAVALGKVSGQKELHSFINPYSGEVLLEPYKVQDWVVHKVITTKIQANKGKE